MVEASSGNVASKAGMGDPNSSTSLSVVVVDAAGEDRASYVVPGGNMLLLLSGKMF